jgi:Flp pilus assembly protein TadD
MQEEKTMTVENQAIAEQDAPPKQLIVGDFEPYLPLPSDFNISLLGTHGAAKLTIFGLPILAIAGAFVRRRRFALFNLLQAFVYLAIGLAITLVLWFVWALIVGAILSISGSATGAPRVFWYAVVLGLIPSLFAMAWIAYPTLYAGDPEIMLKKWGGRIFFPRLTDWLNEKWEAWNLQRLRAKQDRIGEATFLLSQGAFNMDLKRFDRAMGYYRASLDIYRQINDAQRELEVLGGPLLMAQRIANMPLDRFETLHEVALLTERIDRRDRKELYEGTMDQLIDACEDQAQNAGFMARLESLTLKFPHDHILLLARAKAHDERAEFEQAYEDARRAVAIHPDDPYALSILSVALERLGRYENAIEILSRAIAGSPKDGTLYARRAIAYIELGDQKAAREDIENTIRIAPRAEYTRGIQALALLVDGDFSKADRYFQIAANQEENSARWHFGLALTKLASGDYKAALDLFVANVEKASRADREFADRWLNRLSSRLPSTPEEIQAIADLVRY